MLWVLILGYPNSWYHQRLWVLRLNFLSETSIKRLWLVLHLSSFRLCYPFRGNHHSEIKCMFRFFLIKSNCSTTKSFVNISTHWCSISMNCISITPFWTQSLIKWCFISMCLTLWRWEKHKKGRLNCVCFFFCFLLLKSLFRSR